MSLLSLFAESSHILSRMLELKHKRNCLQRRNRVFSGWEKWARRFQQGERFNCGFKQYSHLLRTIKYIICSFLMPIEVFLKSINFAKRLYSQT